MKACENNISPKIQFFAFFRLETEKGRNVLQISNCPTCFIRKILKKYKSNEIAKRGHD